MKKKVYANKLNEPYKFFSALKKIVYGRIIEKKEILLLSIFNQQVNYSSLLFSISLPFFSIINDNRNFKN